MVKKKLMIGVLVILLFFMTFVSASVCGNGVIEEGEACDDGNTADLDACSSTCICVDSDGGKDTLVKGVACYFGQCTYDICGGTTIIYGVSYVVNEAYCVGDRAFKNPINCDPGYHCSNGACVLSCGDGTVSETEECDGNSESCTDSNGYNGTKSCLSDCTWDLSCITTESCGDGIVNGNEECDDSNIINGDGCSSICKIEYPDNVTSEQNETTPTNQTTTSESSPTTTSSGGGGSGGGGSGTTSDSSPTTTTPESDQTTEITEAIVSEDGNFCPQGCLYKNVCFPISIRKKIDDVNVYCNINISEEGNFTYVWDIQKVGDWFCDNNYECRSNLCIEDRCVEQELFTRIINWFKKLFGIVTLNESEGTNESIETESNQTGQNQTAMNQTIPTNQTDITNQTIPTNQTTSEQNITNGTN